MQKWGYHQLNPQVLNFLKQWFCNQNEPNETSTLRFPDSITQPVVGFPKATFPLSRHVEACPRMLPVSGDISTCIQNLVRDGFKWRITRMNEHSELVYYGRGT